jgi:hypothetical protein
VEGQPRSHHEHERIHFRRPELCTLATQVAFNESSRLNGIAALWTGAAAILSAAASMLGVL